ncbi:MAG: hypothetical protein KJ077_00255 [Anaerolineae bacterium]|nr:hypothetical protein [Anaerolineae bacterium]
MRQAVPVKRHQDATPAGDLILEFGLASLAGYEHMQDLKLGAHPLTGDQAVADAWDIEFRHYTTVSRLLYDLDDEAVKQINATLEALIRPYLVQAVNEVLRQQEGLTLCGDLTGRAVSTYSRTYPPDTVFGYMANQLCKEHQAVLVTLKGQHHRVHVLALHQPGNTVSGSCLQTMVTETERRLGCRPRRRTELIHQRIATLEAKIRHKAQWCAEQQRTIRQQLERQVRLGEQLQQLRTEISQLEHQYQGRTVRTYSALARAQQRRASKQGQLLSALDQEAQARQALQRHQHHLEELQQERATLVQRLAELELDNATLINPVRMRWLLDGGFGDAANVTCLIEMGYDLYTMAHNGKTTQMLRQEVGTEAIWTKVGCRTEALDMSRQQLGECPYPVRLTLLRWSSYPTFNYSTLISFSETDLLPLADLFPTYHQRQDIEAGIKQAKGIFSFTKLRGRSPAGLALLGQFALFFWPNFVHWDADWLADQAHSGADRFEPLWQRVHTQVRVAANTPAVVLTSPKGQWLQFDADGPFAGPEISLDGPFHYQLPLPLYQSWSQLWPTSSSSVKEQLATLIAKQGLHPVPEEVVVSPASCQPEKIPKF